MSDQEPPPGQRHELTDAEKRDPRGWFFTRPAEEEPPEVPCHRDGCGVIGETKRYWQTFGNGTTHVREDCTACGAYIRYVKQTPGVLAAMGPPPAATPAPEQGGLFQ